MDSACRWNGWSDELGSPDGRPTRRLVHGHAAHEVRSGLAPRDRGRVPTAFTKLRSTYRHEADSAIGFQAFNDPAAMGTASDFISAASGVGYAFNWFYVNSTQSAYFNSGLNPVRPSGVNPSLPTRADPAYEWQGWNPDLNTATYTSVAAHPQSSTRTTTSLTTAVAAIKRRMATSASARCRAAARRPVKAAIAAGQKYDRAGLVRVMADAAVTDLRASSSATCSA
jgi:hypothetical protein